MLDLFAGVPAGWTIPGTGVQTQITQPGQVVALILNILIWIVVALAIGFIVFGGIKYITSGGDEKKVASAKNTLLYAVIGVIVALLASVIIRLVLGALGANNIQITG